MCLRHKMSPSLCFQDKSRTGGRMRIASLWVIGLFEQHGLCSKTVTGSFAARLLCWSDGQDTARGGSTQMSRCLITFEQRVWPVRDTASVRPVVQAPLGKLQNTERSWDWRGLMDIHLHQCTYTNTDALTPTFTPTLMDLHQHLTI